MSRSKFSDWIIYKYELDAEHYEGVLLYIYNNVRGFCYRCVMKFMHKYDWHHAPPIHPDGDTQLWCQWCGLRYTIKHNPSDKILSIE